MSSRHPRPFLPLPLQLERHDRPRIPSKSIPPILISVQASQKRLDPVMRNTLAPVPARSLAPLTSLPYPIPIRPVHPFMPPFRLLHPPQAPSHVPHLSTHSLPPPARPRYPLPPHPTLVDFGLKRNGAPALLLYLQAYERVERGEHRTPAEKA